MIRKVILLLVWALVVGMSAPVQLHAQERTAAPSRTDAGTAEQAKPQVTVVLKEVVVSPSEILTAEEIEALTGAYVGREVTVSELYGMVQEFNETYRAKGYVAAAVLPEQPLDDGVVEVRLVEGRVGEIVISGNRHTKTDFISERLGMAPGDLVALDDMERSLLRFNDTYDVLLHAELQAGKTFGTTDVIVHVFEPDNNVYSLWSDSAGRREFGEARYGFSWTNRSLFGRRDALSLSVTKGESSWSGTLSYSVPVARNGTRLVSEYTYSYHDVVGGEFHDVGISGDAATTGVTAHFPLGNRRGDRFSIVAGYRRTDSSTYLEGYRLTGYTLETWRVGTSGSFVRQDGATEWGYAYNLVFGRDPIENEDFSKHTVAGTFKRVFRNNTVLTATVSGQLTDSVLLPDSEQYRLGGMSTVRGYLSDRLTGDEGYLVNVEWTGTWRPWLQWTLYLDHGGVFPYKGNLEPVTEEDYVTSAALGLHVQITHYLHGNLLWGTPLNNDEDGVVYARLQVNF